MTHAVIIVLDATNFMLVLLLVALGLVIIFGLMNVINMAHGELFLLGAYTVVLVRAAWRPLLARPAAGAAGAGGCSASLVEELVIRHVYHRFIDTILATWGLSHRAQAGGDRGLRPDRAAGRQPAPAAGRGARRGLPGLSPVHHGGGGRGRRRRPSCCSTAPGSGSPRAA